MRAGTRFQLCSVSKQFTAAAVMLLAESGRLDVREPVGRWLPGGPLQWRRVTLHQLLLHTVGVPHWREAPGLDPAEPMTISERLEIIQATPLRAEPGAQRHYSSPGFVLAGLIVERATSRPYRDFLAERILSPLRLTQTTVGGAPDAAARGHRDGQPVPAWDLDAMPGSGDIWSTTGDLARFTAALHRGELVAASSLRAMCTAHAAPGDQDDGDPPLTTTGYGYGMFIGILAGTRRGTTPVTTRAITPSPPGSRTGQPASLSWSTTKPRASRACSGSCFPQLWNPRNAGTPERTPSHRSDADLGRVTWG